MRRISLLVCALAACTRVPPPSPVSAPVATLPLRLVDHAADAQVDGDLLAAYATLGYPLVSVSPLPSAPDEAFPRALQVAFAEAELGRLLSGADKATPQQKKIDLTWNRNRGIYEAREALFLPAGVTYRYALPAGPAAILRGEVGRAPGSASAMLVVELSGHALSATAVEKPGRWQPIEVTLPARAERTTLAIHADGGTAFLGEPVVRAAAPSSERPNIVFILVDTLRQDALVAMPRLRRAATRGARLTQAITAATWTRPSLIATLGGDLPTRLGHSAEDMIPEERERRRFRALRPPLLPRRLAEAGYVTRAIGNNFFLLGFPRIGLDLGIDSVTDVRDLMLDTPAISAEAVRFLEAPHEAPFFLYLHYDAPHWPYTPPPVARAAARGLTLEGLDATRDPMIGAYLGEAAYADRGLGDVLDALDRTGLANDTIVVVLGDHGEVFDPAHAYTVEAIGQPTLHHHGWSAYDEILRVPLVFSWPGHIAPRVVDTQTSLVDVAPTLAELVGLPALPGPRLPAQGRSLAQALLDPRAAWPSAGPAFVEGQDVRALRSDGWLYLVRSNGRLKLGAKRRVGREELYELATDPLQHHDRVDDEAAAPALARMRAALRAIAPALPGFPEPVLHLAVADDERPHRVRGEVRCVGCRIAIRAIERGRAAPATTAGVALDLDGGARVELVVDPPDAPLSLALSRDGIALDADHLLIGPLALPLLGGSARVAAADGVVPVPAARLSWLDARRAPYVGDAGEVVLWRDPAASTESAGRAAAADSEVATMMQRWGYAQPATKHPDEHARGRAP